MAASVALSTGILAAAVLPSAFAQAQSPLKFGFGKAATAEEIAGWDIDVRPDGAGLPPGRGSVAQGQIIYDEKCANCHGTFGESNSYMQIAGGVGSLASDQPVRTTGSKLNYATTLWDYIRRAMPFNAPQTLTVDEVYALTAYVLNLNDILPADALLDRAALLALKLPNRDGFTTHHGFMRRDGKPDTHNVACMKDCVADVRLTSQIPDFAKDQHGNLAEQSRVLGVSTNKKAHGSAPTKTGGELARSYACTACHGVSSKIVGPGFREVAAKYAGDSAAQANLADKIKAGGVGVWGSVAMPPQPQISEADLRLLMQWILAGAN